VAEMKTEYLLALNAHEKIGSQTIKKALASFDEDIEKLYSASTSELNSKLGNKIAGYITEAKNNFNAEEEIEKLQRLNIGYMTLYDKNYPPLLKETPDFPAILYIRGDISALKLPSIAVVGSRKYSLYGKKVAYSLSKKISEAGLSIVSGLALGIDAVSHRAALDAGGITVGVLGCGLDKIYPASNLSIGREILEKGGAIISEFPPGTPPLVHHFPQRNRIIAGLSLGTLVVEAAEESGALITAYCALDYNREVFAVPGTIDAETSKGTNMLIQKGAKMVTKPEDIFEELDVKVKKSEQKAKENFPESPEEKKITECLKTGDKSVDEIIAETKLNVVALNRSLSMMEMKGMVENLGGSRFKLC